MRLRPSVSPVHTCRGPQPVRGGGRPCVGPTPPQPHPTPRRGLGSEVPQLPRRPSPGPHSSRGSERHQAQVPQLAPGSPAVNSAKAKEAQRWCPGRTRQLQGHPRAPQTPLSTAHTPGGQLPSLTPGGCLEPHASARSQDRRHPRLHHLAWTPQWHPRPQTPECRLGENLSERQDRPQGHPASLCPCERVCL